MNIDTEKFFYFQFSFIYKLIEDRQPKILFGSGVCRQKENSNFCRQRVVNHFNTKLQYNDINIFSWSKITKEEFYEFNFRSIDKRSCEETSEEEIIIHSTTTRIL